MTLQEASNTIKNTTTNSTNLRGIAAAPYSSGGGDQVFIKPSLDSRIIQLQNDLEKRAKQIDYLLGVVNELLPLVERERELKAARLLINKDEE